MQNTRAGSLRIHTEARSGWGRWKLVWCTIGVCLGLAPWLSRVIRAELSIDAKPLSEWLQDLNAFDSDEKNAAEAAVRKGGPNAIPALLRRLNARDTHLRRLRRILNEWLIPRLGNRELMKSDETLRSEAVLAFRVLGSSASASLPLLFRLLTNAPADTGAPVAIAQSMAGIGAGSIGYLRAGLDNPQPWIRRASLLALMDLEMAAADALPDAARRTKDPDTEVRGLALVFISEVSKDKNEKRRLFEAAVSDSDPQIRFYVQKELRELAEHDTPVP